MIGSKNKVIRNIVLLLAGVLIFVFLIVFKFDFSEFVATISDKISWGFYVFISSLIIVQLLIRSVRFKLLFNHVFEDRISLKNSFLLTGASFFVALATPNKLGDTTRGFFFRKKGVEITAIVLIEYLFDTFVLVGIAFCGLVFMYREYLSKFVLFFVILIIGMAVLFYLFKHGKVEEFVNRFNWYQKIHSKIELLKSHFKRSFKSKFVLSVAFIFSCFFISIYFSIFYLVLYRLGADVSMIDVLLSTSVGVFVGCLTFIPMGMGTRDASTYVLLCSIGIDSEIAISSVIIMRSLSVTLLLVCGFCYFLAINHFDNEQ